MAISGEVMPSTDLNGWRLIFNDDFTTAAALGSWPPDTTRWSAYPNTYPDTSHNGTYDPAKTLSQSGDVLDMAIHYDASGVSADTTQVPTGEYCVAAPYPLLPAGDGDAHNGQLYGRYAARFKSDALPGYKTAWLLWSTTYDAGTATWPANGEIDFPEAKLDGTSDIAAFMHYEGATTGSQQDAYTSATVEADGAWHTVVLEWGPAACSFYLDGVLLGSSTSNIPNTAMRWVLQTETQLSGVAPATSVSGHLQVDWVAIWAYDTNATGPTDGNPYVTAVEADRPSSLYLLTETSGTTAADSVGSAPGTYVGGVTLGVGSIIPGDTSDTAATFDGSSGWVEITASVVNPNPYSVEATFKLGAIPASGAGLVCFGDVQGNGGGNTGASRRLLYIGTDGKLRWGVYTTTNVVLTSPASVCDGVAHHVVATVGPSGGMRLWLDGVQVANSSAVTAGQNYTGYWHLGSSSFSSWPSAASGGAYFGGTLQAVALWNTTELSASQVTAHHQAWAVAQAAHTLGAATRVRTLLRAALDAPHRAIFAVQQATTSVAPVTLVPILPAYAGGSVAFADALCAADALWRAGVDLLASDELTPLEPGGLYDLTAADRLLPGSASVTLDVTQTIMRTLTLSLRSSDGRYLPGARGYPSGGAGSPVATGLTWFTVRYRPWLDLRVGFDANAQPIYQRTYLGVFVLTQPVIQVQVTGAVAQLTLADKSALLQKPYRLTAANLPTYTASGGHTAAGYPAGTTIDAAMSDLATRGGLPLAQLHFEPTTATLPGDYAVAEGDEPWTHLQKLAATLGHILYFDATGNLVRRTNPLAQNTPPVWTFAPGPLSTIAQLARTSDFSNTFNHIIVVGGSSATALVRGEATVTDPASPYHSNSIGDRVAFWGQNGLGDMTPDPTIGTVAAAQAQARLLLAQHLGQQESIQVQGRSIPQLAPYDRITVNVAGAGLATDAQLTQLTIPLTTSAAMSITAAKWLSVGS